MTNLMGPAELYAMQKASHPNVSNWKIPTKYLPQAKWKLQVDFQLHNCSCKRITFVLAIY
jgi:hypothetical protein